MKRILVTCPPMILNKDLFVDSFIKHNFSVSYASVTQAVTEEYLVENLKNYDGWIIGDELVTEKVLKNGFSGNLRAAIKFGSGVDNINFDLFKKYKVSIDNTPNMFSTDLAVLALTYLNILARDLFQIDTEVRKGNWYKPVGSSLVGKNILIIGLGFVGRETARVLQHIGCEVHGYDPYLDSALFGKISKVTSLSETSLDFFAVIVTASANTDNKYLVNKNFIENFTKPFILINISRGSLVSETDLVAGLLSGKIKSAALEVFEDEPLSTSSSLTKIQNVLLGSHNASNTLEGVARAGESAIAKLFKALN